VKFNQDSLIQPHIMIMPAYEPILPLEVLSQRLGISQERIVKLDANENPYGPLPEAMQALAELEMLHIYPDPESRRIRGMLADYLDLPAESIVMGAGADELIDLIIRVTTGPGDRLLNCPPTFGMYGFDAAVHNLKVINVERRFDFQIDTGEMIAQIDKYAPKLLFLAHPNNPDGGLVNSKTIEAVLTRPILVVVDEAYINFSPGGSSWIHRVAEHDNLIVLRTFSKWAGLAGLRIGYGVFPTAFVPHIMKAKQPYNVSVAAESAACASLAQLPSLEIMTAKIVSERRRLAARLQDISWLRPYPSSANFVLCRVIDREAREIKRRLMDQGIMIRFFDKAGLRDHIRISVGKPGQNDILIEALRAME
jgi:histidinol-phosphate aminotransferase